jgi:hypothetical protein
MKRWHAEHDFLDLVGTVDKQRTGGAEAHSSTRLQVLQGSLESLEAKSLALEEVASKEKLLLSHAHTELQAQRSAVSSLRESVLKSSR